MVCVLIVGSGAEWETRALAVLNAAPGVVVLKRCVDINDLLATASAGQADVAVVDLDAHGLDGHAMDHLRRHQVRTIGITDEAGTDRVRTRAGRLGVRTVVGEADLETIGALVADAARLPDNGPATMDRTRPPVANTPGTPTSAPTHDRQSAQTQQPTNTPGLNPSSYQVGPGGPLTNSPTAPRVAGDPLAPSALDAEYAALLSGEQSGGDAGGPGGLGRILAIWGPAGAPGRTTLTLAVAAELAARGVPTLAVDADPYGGTLAQQLGVMDEVSGLLSAARYSNSGTLEDRFASVQRQVSPQLRVITGLPRADRWVEIRAGALEHVLETAQKWGEVIVDTGFCLEDDPGSDFGSLPGRNSMTLGTLSVADEIAVVGSADPVGLSRLARSLVELRDLQTGLPVRVVVNRMRSTLGWSEADITSMIGDFLPLSSIHFLPEDRAHVDKALIAGRTVRELGDAPLVRAVSGFVDAIAPLTAGAPAKRKRAGRGRQR